MSSHRKVIVYIAMSLDGFIAGINDDLGFLSMVEKAGEDYGYKQFIQTVDTVILGRRTYDKVLSFGIPFPHANKQTFVITHTPRPTEGNITFYTGHLKALVEQLQQENGKNIFVDGGAEIVNELLKEELIEEFIISVIPTLLGNGTALFKPGRPSSTLALINSTSFDTGLIQLHYKVLK